MEPCQCSLKNSGRLGSRSKQSQTCTFYPPVYEIERKSANGMSIVEGVPTRVCEVLSSLLDASDGPDGRDHPAPALRSITTISPARHGVACSGTPRRHHQPRTTPVRMSLLTLCKAVAKKGVNNAISAALCSRVNTKWFVGTRISHKIQTGSPRML